VTFNPFANEEVAAPVTAREPEERNDPPVMVTPCEEVSPAAVTPPAKVEVPVPRSLVVEARPVPKVTSWRVANLPSKPPATKSPPADVEVATFVKARVPIDALLVTVRAVAAAEKVVAALKVLVPVQA
jgi:hypothetical protein